MSSFLKRVFLYSILSIASTAYCDSTYNSIVPGSSDSPLYYKVGGGNVVPVAPSLRSSLSIDINGLGAAGYNCGSFNLGSSISNSLNGLENTAMSMFNNVVDSATGAVVEMPAYIIAKANPSLYQLLQNGLFSGQWDINTGLKSCQQMQSDIDNGRDPYSGMFSTSQAYSWKAFQNNSSPKVRMNNLTYTQSSASDISLASQKVAQDNGGSGVPWIRGNYKNGAYYAGGLGQPAIQMTSDMTVAGVNALLSRSDFDSKSAIPKTDGLYTYFKTPQDAADWAVSVLGENDIHTSSTSISSATAGKGLLPLVQKQYQDIYQDLFDMINGSKDIDIENLKKVSSDRVMLSKQTIQDIQGDSSINKDFEISTLAQGVASSRVVDKAQELIIILQAARQVPSIATNKTAQEFIDRYISTLNQQINLVVNNNETSKKLLVNTIETLNQSHKQKEMVGNSSIGISPSKAPLINGVVQKENS
ncbi:integrating conjugative element protein [Francisella sp. SYW-9]|uniref:integrating conjugative element protein n=1 Tax=Francisella sp. SYW-9 TaxID=2610888 RepID=UPI00123CB0F2|nr:integrating conjugative element protein [Francisella sp. SYW-9]